MKLNTTPHLKKIFSIILISVFLVPTTTSSVAVLVDKTDEEISVNIEDSSSKSFINACCLTVNEQMAFNFTPFEDGFIWKSIRTYNITWTTLNSSITQIDIRLYDADGYVKTLANDVANNDHRDMIISYYGSSPVQSNSTYYLRIQDSTNSSIFADSDVFEFQREWVEIYTKIKPNRRYSENEVMTIYFGYMSSGLTEFKLYHLSKFVRKASTSFSGGSVNETNLIIWGGVSDDYNYTIRAENPGGSDETQQFILTGENAKIIPNPVDTNNETYQWDVYAGSTIEISWSTEGDVKYVYVYYRMNSQRIDLLSGTDNPGKLSWQIPFGQEIIWMEFGSVLHGNSHSVQFKIIGYKTTAPIPNSNDQSSTTRTITESTTSTNRSTSSKTNNTPSPFLVIFPVLVMLGKFLFRRKSV
ncbi:MAG: hypothetical protein HeimC2_24100 [Candidatus Heimdallarchaeota archaeon LC_2]|nr:MAG: hypothetical protein HeimC2_24100 [Candidatus Heimdallarchaeota archaeon LC_2]